MGQVHSQVVAGAPYNVSPQRLNVWEFQCHLNGGDQTGTGSVMRPVNPTVLVRATANTHSASASPSTSSPQSPSEDGGVSSNDGILRLTASKSDRLPLTFVMDPETQEMLLKLPYQPSLTLRFSLTMALVPGNSSTRLIFAHAGSAQELQQVVSQRQTELWTEVGHWAEPAHPKILNFDFLFVWDAQEDKPGGQPIHFAFFMDGPSSSSKPRAGGAVWVSERPVTDINLFDDPANQSAASPICPDPPTPYTPTPYAPTPTTITPSSGLKNASQPHQKPQQQSQTQPQQQSPTQQSQQQSKQPKAATSSGDNQMPYGVPLASQQERFFSKAPRPTVEHNFQPDDGPQFRSSIASMERRVPSLKIRIKQLLKRSLMSRERMQALVEADTWLASGIQEAARYDCGSFRPVSDWFSRSSEGGLSAIQRQRKVCLNEFTTRIIEPLQQFYEYDIKCFEQRKREFEEESSQFYSWTSRYLSARKEARRSKTTESSDAKFAIKKRSFDAARFDYFSYLSDLTTGLKQQVLLQLLALAAQSLTDSHIALGNEFTNRTQPKLDETVEDIKVAARDWEKYRIEKLQYRRSLLEDTDGSNSGAGAAPGTSGASGTSAASSGVSGNSNSTNSNNTSNIGQGSPELGPGSLPGTQNYKEGLLWASSRPGGHQESQIANKQSLQNLKWHKYWVVLDGTSLREYTNWKQSVDLHNEPINLLVAGVREARNTERRFCFEIVTPQYKRVYQATSEDDMRLWILAIHKSISTLLESTDDTLQHPQIPNSPTRENEIEVSKRGSSPNDTSNSSSTSTSPSRTNGDRIESLTRKLSLKSDKPRVPPIVTSMGSSNQQSIVGSPRVVPSPHPNPIPHHFEQQQHHHPHHHHQSHFRRPVGEGITPVASPQAMSAQPKTSPFDELLYRIHSIPSNRVCAECNSNKSVEWVSINLLMVLCIECSGAHRSLGAHISKVRSLNLDTGAFTESLKAALLSVSNETMNKIWEARLPAERKLQREATGQARVKFVTEKYIEKQYIVEVEKPNSVLRRAISERDIPKMCAALASRANPNGVSDADEPMLIHALRSALPTDTAFPVAEVLIKNGATVPPPDGFEGLNERMQEFLRRKQAQP